MKKISFMKIDVEGYEYEVIAGNDWEQYRPQVLCIEANHIIKDWHSLIKRSEYELVFFDGLNEYFVAKEASEIADRFSYVQTILAKPPIPLEYAQVTARFEGQLASSEAVISNLRLESRNLAAQINQLQYEMIKMRRIRSLVKMLLKALDAAVQVRIQHLNKPRAVEEKPLHLPDTKDPAEVLKALRIYDLNFYYSFSSGDRFLYKLMNKTYLFLSRGLFRIMLPLTGRVRRG